MQHTGSRAAKGSRPRGWQAHSLYAAPTIYPDGNKLSLGARKLHSNPGGCLPSAWLCAGAYSPCMLSCINNSNSKQCNHSLHRHCLTAMAEEAAPAVAAAVDSGEAPAAPIMASGSILPARTTPGAARARAASSSIQVRSIVDVRLELASGVGDGRSVVGHLVVQVQQDGRPG